MRAVAAGTIAAALLGLAYYGLTTGSIHGLVVVFLFLVGLVMSGIAVGQIL